MNREVHAGFCEQLRGQFPRLTHPIYRYGILMGVPRGYQVVVDPKVTQDEGDPREGGR